MKRQEFSELAALSAIGALDGEDLTAFESYLAQAGSEELKELNELKRVASMLEQAHGSGQFPPPELKRKIMERIGQEQPGREDPNPVKFPAVTHEVIKGFSFLSEAEGEWRQLPAKGARVKELVADSQSRYTMLLLDLEAGAEYPAHHHLGAEEGFMVSGDLHMFDRVLGPGDFFHAEAGSDHGPTYSEGGCRLLLVTSNQDYPRRSLRLYGYFRKTLGSITKVFQTFSAEKSNS